MIRFLGLVIFLCFNVAHGAETREDEVMRRLVVFPVKSDQDYGSALDDAWWKIREELSQTQRFLIASRQFLQQKDVFQPRGLLSPADVIILGKLLDAQAIVIAQVERRNLRMVAYAGEDGSLLWDHTFALHPSLPIKAQLVDSSRRLIQDFIASIPYQGYVLRDELAGSAVSESNGRKLVKVDIGRRLQATSGDPIQFIRVQRQSLKPLFEDGGQVNVIAEGVVVKPERDYVVVQVTRQSKGEVIEPYTPIKLPKEYQRLRKEFTLAGNEALNPSVVTQDLQQIRSSTEETKPLVTALGFVSSIAAFLLLAL